MGDSRAKPLRISLEGVVLARGATATSGSRCSGRQRARTRRTTWCPHQGYALKDGDIRGGVLTRAWHNWTSG